VLFEERQKGRNNVGAWGDNQGHGDLAPASKIRKPRRIAASGCLGNITEPRVRMEVIEEVLGGNEPTPE